MIVLLVIEEGLWLPRELHHLAHTNESLLVANALQFCMKVVVVGRASIVMFRVGKETVLDILRNILKKKTVRLLNDQRINGIQKQLNFKNHYSFLCLWHEWSFLWLLATSWFSTKNGTWNQAFERYSNVWIEMNQSFIYSFTSIWTNIIGQNSIVV